MMGIVALCAVLAAGSGAARAQDAREAQLVGFHQLRDRGACVRFGTTLRQNRDRYDGWRRSHLGFPFER